MLNKGHTDELACMTQTSYKFRFYPTRQQRQQLAVDFGCARYVWNYALNRRSVAYKEQNEKLTGVDLSREVAQTQGRVSSNAR